ncbi:hypothetical protein FRACYDRAFT_243278 [Fragilariopsis cylindrus CCMP1102]|uniref:Uncharacterized protein n=1 Tax=Fragilariopsis cylindrus CCMP1102 TaxID=635003 RepID=A0A1E7F4B4_9STRA|nr:hypothetical protein FRACYDRAFT_243278 [Fragilariopsis cylindrus CCMP1102]|eukprot:OEU12976.1 hypothetical protein FRACYDRAFT_243278 [Fragilariopsis cylindrus CCMP1102]
MEYANIDNEDGQEHQAADARRRRRLELITVLQKTEEFPFRSENKTDELVETFLETLKDDIHDMICERDHDDGNYQGLDSDRDTEAEVETVLRLFPGVMTRRKEIAIYEGDDDDDEEEEEERVVLYPIQFLAVTLYPDGSWSSDQWCNVKSAPFIPLVARLAIEFGLFDEQHRGGLLFEDETHDIRHVLHYLICSDPIERRSQEYHEHIDDKYLQVLIQLRKMGLLKKEDIQKYDLLNDLSCHYFHSGEKRFRFLVQWDPSALTHTTEYSNLPLRSSYLNRDSIRGFQSIFEYGIHYFPKKKGINLLFIKTNEGDTPFKIACEKYGHEQVMEVVEDTLIRYSTSLDNHASPLNIVEALMMAAIDENVHIDCVYFLIRREPDILVKLLSNPSPLAITAVSNRNNNNDNDKNDDSNYNNSNDKNDGTSNPLGRTKRMNSKTTITERKRKRD